jgi:diguanylate cyclase (GGDEF)-like protein
LEGWNKGIKLTHVLLIAGAYILCARFGQLFAIEPGNVTPVWIPSGILLALALRFGPQIWPGVFLGAFLGNIWAYFSTESVQHVLTASGSAALNGLGDVLSIVLMAQVIKTFAGTHLILRNYQSLLYFLAFGVILGPLISALFGSGGLWAFGHINTDVLSNVFLTWWLGDAVGSIIFAPFMLSWLTPERQFAKSANIILVSATAYSLLLTSLVFDLVNFSANIEHMLFIPSPFLFAILFRYGQRLVFTVQVAVLSIAVIATWRSLGPFASNSTLASLLELQSFAAAFSLAIFTIAIMNLEKTSNEAFLEKRTKELEELYRKDQLTGVWNRYRLKEYIRQALQRLKRSSTPSALLILDIDNFKHVNDVHGHNTGDRVLKQLAHTIHAQIREVDCFGRWGGEEFLLILDHGDKAALEIMSEKLLQLIRNEDFGLNETLTISIGGTLGKLDDNELSIVERADEALYKAKHSGKDCACFTF